MAQTRYAYYAYLPRKTARVARRLFAVLILGALIFAIYDLRQPEHHRIVKRDTFESLGRSLDTRSRSHHHHHHSHDVRIWPTWAGINTMFVFGDSTCDTGFNPHGPQPDLENPLGNPAWPGRTSSYGPNFLAYMTATFNQSTIRTYVYANRLSPFRTHTESLHLPSLHEQVDTKFVSTIGPSSKPTSRSGRGSGSWSRIESLFVLFHGVNEILFTAKDRGGGKNATTIENNVEDYGQAMEKLYEAGGRNFLIVNIPQLEEAPFMETSGVINWIWDLGAEIVQYNGRLAFMAHTFAERHLDTNVFVFNNHNLSINVRREPKRFPDTASYTKLKGFCFPYIHDHWWTDTAGVFDESCKVPLNQYFWRDDMHVTEPYHKLMARQIVDLLKDPRQRLPLEFY